MPPSADLPSICRALPAEGSTLKPSGAAAPRDAQWLEWEASVLRPASYLGGEQLDAALAELAAAAAEGSFLAGGEVPSLADVSGQRLCEGYLRAVEREFFDWIHAIMDALRETVERACSAAAQRVDLQTM
jgi:hypothetical protein